MALIRGPLIDVATFPTPHEAYGLCAAGLPQFKASGLAVVFDLTAHTFYPLSPNSRSPQTGEERDQEQVAHVKKQKPSPAIG